MNIGIIFSKEFHPGLDRVYVYKTDDDIKVGEICNVETPNGLKQGKCIKVNAKAPKDIELKNAYKRTNT